MPRRKNYDSPFDKDDFENNNKKSNLNQLNDADYINYDDQDFLENEIIDRSLSNLPTRYLMTLTSVNTDEENDGYEKFKEDEGLK